MTWHPTSWQQQPITQAVAYRDQEKLTKVLQRLEQMPPLVPPFEIDRLKQLLAKAQMGEQFLLQGGDCAESFADCEQGRITNKLRILLQMSVILIHGLQKPVIRVGRIAGQYAKPRSNPEETIDGVTLPSYRGDLINGVEFTPASRIPNPERLLSGYFHAAATLNHLRALSTSGFADLQHPEYWNLDFAQSSPMAEAYQQIAKSIGVTLAFIKTIGVNSEILRTVDFYTSHEALHLPYDAALTKQAQQGKFYNLSTHFPWVGMRTCALESAHLEYLRGIANPVAVKVGPSVSKDWLQSIVKILNPENEPGRLTLITRLGVNQVATLLPDIINTVKKTGIGVVWSCDPMHGNTTQAGDYKTRRFDDILMELKSTFAIHQQQQSHLSGVHFELTGDNVTECIGGASGIEEADLKHAYQTLVDPRLNYEQALEMALQIVHSIGQP